MATKTNINLRADDVVRALENAFRPLECVVELFDYRKRLRFRVFSPEDKPLLTVREYLMRRAVDAGSLSTIVRECRRRVEAKGYKLNPWNVSDYLPTSP